MCYNSDERQFFHPELSTSEKDHGIKNTNNQDAYSSLFFPFFRDWFYF